MSSLKIIFMGTADFAVPSLKKLCESSHHVLAVVTAPDLPRGRGQKILFTPVKEFALAHHLPVIQPGTEKGALRDPAFIAELKKYQADLFVVVAFRILPPEIFQLPPHGSINLHASLLPKYRGAAPINWAIIRGEKETGVTTFFIQQKVDTGNLILQRSLPIGDNETAGELHDRLAGLGAEALLETVNLVAEDCVQLTFQNESQATSAPKIFKEDCKINWNQPARVIQNFIRGLSPYPCAFSIFNGEPYKIFKSELEEKDVSEMPAVAIVEMQNKGFAVVCGDNKILWIKEIQPPSKKRMSVSDFIRGHKIEKFQKFE
ncbi:methionyl-tRNA formyltransferase [bacterium]|nr:methionyl-tRNA formyltransferase [bacterium]